MVTVNFKLHDTGTVKVKVNGAEALENILQRCSVNAGYGLGGYIAVRENRVITDSELVKDFDEIDVFPALSGG